MATRTWTSVAGANKLWSDAANWSGGVAPTSTDDVVFNAGAVHVYINNAIPALCKTLTITAGYTGDFGVFEQGEGFFDTQRPNIGVYGSITITKAYTGNPTLTMHNTGTLSFTGTTISAFNTGTGASGEGNATVCTLSGNLNVGMLNVIAGTTFAQGANAVTVSGGFGVSIAGTFSWSAGATWTLTPTLASALYIQYNSTPGYVLPPTTVATTASLGVTLFNLVQPTFTSLVVQSGSYLQMTNGASNTFDTVGNCTFNGFGFSSKNGATNTPITVGGNLLITSGNYSDQDSQNWKINVVGTAVAHNATFAHCDASGGTTIDANDNCTDGGNNINIDPFAPPAPPSTTWVGTDNGLANTAANWSPAVVPTLTNDVVISGATSLTFDTNLDTLTCDASGYTGTMTAINPNGGDGLVVREGGVNLSAATIVAPYIYLELYSPAGAAHINLGTNAVEELFLDNEGAADSNIAIIGRYFEATGDFDLQAFTIDMTPAANVSSHYVGFEAVLTWDAGAKVILRPNTHSTATAGLILYNPAQNVLPPIEIRGTGTDAAKPNENVSCQSFLLVSGRWDFDGHDLATQGDMTFTGGSVTNAGVREVNCLGNFTTNVSISGGVWSVGGTAVAHNATITGCDFSGGTELDATDGCTNGGGNTNVDFGVVASTTACLLML